MYKILDINNVKKYIYLDQIFAKYKYLKNKIILIYCLHKKLIFKNNYSLFLTNY